MVSLRVRKASTFAWSRCCARTSFSSSPWSVACCSVRLVIWEEKLVLAQQRLQAKVEAFRTRKETIKATYTAAEAQTRIGEAMSGIGEEMGDVGLAIQRAEDKTAQMQARAGAIDELIASGALDDVSTPGGGDDIARELDALGSAADVEAELARLKAGSAPPQAIEASEGGDILAEQPEAVRAEGDSTDGGRA